MVLPVIYGNIWLLLHLQPASCSLHVLWAVHSLLSDFSYSSFLSVHMFKHCGFVNFFFLIFFFFPSSIFEMWSVCSFFALNHHKPNSGEKKLDQQATFTWLMCWNDLTCTSLGLKHHLELFYLTPCFLLNPLGAADGRSEPWAPGSLFQTERSRCPRWQFFFFLFLSHSVRKPHPASNPCRLKTGRNQTQQICSRECLQPDFSPRHNKSDSTAEHERHEKNKWTQHGCVWLLCLAVFGCRGGRWWSVIVEPFPGYCAGFPPCMLTMCSVCFLPSARGRVCSAVGLISISIHLLNCSMQVFHLHM